MAKKKVALPGLKKSLYIYIIDLILIGQWQDYS